MARRKRQSTAEDLMDLVAMLPWWGGVALAFVSYLVLHAMAGATSAPVQPGRVGDFMLTALLRGFAQWLQYLVPMLCLFGALGSFLRRRKRTDLLRSATASGALEVIARMSWREFEMLVGEGFRQQGYQVTELGGDGPDGGVDLVLRKGGEVFLVQCKHWRAQKVRVDVVRELYGVMAARGAAGGYVVTAGDFTADAQAFADGRNVELVNGARLQQLLQQGRARDAKPLPPSSAAPAAAAAIPDCPACTAPMTRRTARKGANAGKEFWGCTRFPVCKGTR